MNDVKKAELLARFRKRIEKYQQEWVTDVDRTYAEMKMAPPSKLTRERLAADVEDLTYVFTTFAAGDLGTAARTADRLDTVVRDFIPTGILAELGYTILRPDPEDAES